MSGGATRGGTGAHYPSVRRPRCPTRPDGCGAPVGARRPAHLVRTGPPQRKPHPGGHMHPRSSGVPAHRSAKVRGLTITAAAGLLVAALPSGVAAAGGSRTWVVHPGESIQTAVDQAHSGDTI